MSSGDLNDYHCSSILYRHFPPIYQASLHVPAYQTPHAFSIVQHGNQRESLGVRVFDSWSRTWRLTFKWVMVRRLCLFALIVLPYRQTQRSFLNLGDWIFSPILWLAGIPQFSLYTKRRKFAITEPRVGKKVKKSLNLNYKKTLIKA